MGRADIRVARMGGRECGPGERGRGRVGRRGCDVALDAEVELEATVRGAARAEDDVGGLRCSSVRRTAPPRAWVRGRALHVLDA